MNKIIIPGLEPNTVRVVEVSSLHPRRVVQVLRLDSEGRDHRQQGAERREGGVAVVFFHTLKSQCDHAAVRAIRARRMPDTAIRETPGLKDQRFRTLQDLFQNAASYPGTRLKRNDLTAVQSALSTLHQAEILGVASGSNVSPLSVSHPGRVHASGKVIVR